MGARDWRRSSLYRRPMNQHPSPYAGQTTSQPLQPGDHVKTMDPSGNVVVGRVMQIRGWSVDVLWENHHRSWMPYGRLSHLEPKAPQRGVAASRLTSIIAFVTGSHAIVEGGIWGAAADGERLFGLTIAAVLSGVLAIASRRAMLTYAAAATAAFAALVTGAVVTGAW